jgi:DNA recombination-dependent growth factor C
MQAIAQKEFSRMTNNQSVQKTKVTEEQLKDDVLKRLGRKAFLTVHRHKPPVNYSVGIVTAPAHAVAAQQAVDNIVDELRPLYELSD